MYLWFPVVITAQDTVVTNVVLHDFFFFCSFSVKFLTFTHQCPWSSVSVALPPFCSSSSAAVSVPAAACTRCAASRDVSSPQFTINTVYCLLKIMFLDMELAAWSLAKSLIAFGFSTVNVFGAENRPWFHLSIWLNVLLHSDVDANIFCISEELMPYLIDSY